MDIQKLTKFFMWCTIINGAILVFSIIGTIFGADIGLRIQSQWFQIPPETLRVAMYSLLGIFKIFWLIFNVVPYAALVIVGK